MIVVKKAYFTGEFAHMRAILPLYHNIIETSEYKDTIFYFKDHDEGQTFEDIVDDIEFKMNLVYNYKNHI